MVIHRIHHIAENTSRALECEAEVEIKTITPAVNNHPNITSHVQAVAARLFPNDQLDFTTTTMGSEDMAYVLQKFPGCYFFIGSANLDKKLDASHHNPKFDFDESILPKAVALMVASTIELLGTA
jgi:amidohydrolase